MWSAQDDEGMAYIYHSVLVPSLRDAGLRSGVTKLDLNTREETFIDVPHHYSFKDLDVYRGMVCMANRMKGSEDDGLWCLDDAGQLELRIPQDEATGILFVPSSTG